MNDDQMKSDDHLRQRVRHMIQAGKLPLRRADRTFGGPGAGVQCAICEEPVSRDELTIELEFTRDGGVVTSRHHVHVHCFSILELERENGRSAMRTPGERQQSGATAGANGLYADGTKVPVSEKDWVGLVRYIAAGDQSALRALYERTHRLVFTLMVRITDNRETAEELTLDVFSRRVAASCNVRRGKRNGGRLDHEPGAIQGDRLAQSGTDARLDRAGYGR